jgi:hypothetical protein
MLAIGAPARNAAATPVVTPGQLGLAGGAAASVEKTVLICGPWGCYWRPGYWGSYPSIGVGAATIGGAGIGTIGGAGIAIGAAGDGLLLGRPRQRRDEMRASPRQGEPARREGVPFQEKSSERESVGKIGCR